MKYLGFVISLLVTLSLVLALSLDMAGLPPVSDLFDPFRGFWQNLYSEDHRPDEVIRIEGLDEEVEVTYDENLIPHLFAKSDKDLYAVQGYVTAQHRLWQMEFQILAAAGRLSEIVGEQALEFDRMQRRKGLAFGAEAAMRYLEENEPETLDKLEAYAAGVNAYIDQCSFSDLPVEYKLLGYRPSPWTSLNSLLLLKYMADMLVGDVDLEYSNLRFILGEDWMGKLFPDYPEHVDPVIESDRVWAFEGMMPEVPEEISYPDSVLWVNTMDRPEPGVGSNNWAISGSKTKSGFPILANDPHLSLNMPSLWFALQLSTPEYTVKGVSLPGALGVVIGFNQNIAWGVTNATRDVRDWYSITFRDGSRTEYLYNDQWMPSSVRLETIKVKNASDFVDTVIYTHHGPVVYDKDFRANHQKVNFALKWTAHEGSNEQKTFLQLNKASDYQDYLDALDYFTSPAQNFVFASRTGDIALKVQGKFPIKWEGQGKYLMDGSDPTYEWQGFIPYEQNASTLNPKRGFVSSANQHPTDQSYPYYVFDNSFEHYRNRRINNRLGEMEEITVEDVQALQFDNFNLHASEILPTLLTYLEETEGFPAFVSEPGKRYLELLKGWDYHTYPNQEEPTVFAVWWDLLKSTIFQKFKKENISIVLPNDFQTARLIKEEPESLLFDLPESPAVELAADLVKMTFIEAEGKLEEMMARDDLTWSTYKSTSIQHLVPSLTPFGYQRVYTGGGVGMVNATGSRHGASWRMVVELGDGIRAFGIYPGGQSGNPGSKFYGNFIKKWSQGEYVDFEFLGVRDRNRVLFKTDFKPR